MQFLNSNLPVYPPPEGDLISLHHKEYVVSNAAMDVFVLLIVVFSIAFVAPVGR